MWRRILQRQGKLTAENMAPVIDYTRGEYAMDSLRGTPTQPLPRGL